MGGGRLRPIIAARSGTPLSGLAAPKNETVACELVIPMDIIVTFLVQARLSADNENAYEAARDQLEAALKAVPQVSTVEVESEQDG